MSHFDGLLMVYFSLTPIIATLITTACVVVTVHDLLVDEKMMLLLIRTCIGMNPLYMHAYYTYGE